MLYVFDIKSIVYNGGRVLEFVFGFVLFFSRYKMLPLGPISKANVNFTSHSEDVL